MDLKQTLSQMVAYLPNWRLDIREHHQLYLLGPCRTKISCRLKNDRIYFYACLPSSMNHYHSGWNSDNLAQFPKFKPEITCSISRTSRAIAKDLLNRMIVEYLKAHEYTVQQLEVEKNRQDELNHVTHLTLQLLNGKLYSTNQCSLQRRVWFENGKVDVSSFEGGQFRFECNIKSYEQGLKLAAILKEQFV